MWADILQLNVALSSKFKDQKTPEEIGELIDQLGKLLDRTKVMYEQYFMGIQKVAPSQLHRDIERRIRDLTQMHIRNTGLRFRFATFSQKFGSYNTYWKRTVRKIERGEYIRDIARVGRKAAKRGEEIPAEILAKVPERMRKRILRDRERMMARAEREGTGGAEAPAEAETAPTSTASSSEQVREQRSNVHAVDLEDDLDMDSIFASLTNEEPSAASGPVSDFDERPGTYAKGRAIPSGTADRAAKTATNARWCSGEGA